MLLTAHRSTKIEPTKELADRALNTIKPTLQAIQGSMASTAAATLVEVTSNSGAIKIEAVEEATVVELTQGQTIARTMERMTHSAVDNMIKEDSRTIMPRANLREEDGDQALLKTGTEDKEVLT